MSFVSRQCEAAIPTVQSCVIEEIDRHERKSTVRFDWTRLCQFGDQFVYFLCTRPQKASTSTGKYASTFR